MRLLALACVTVLLAAGCGGPAPADNAPVGRSSRPVAVSTPPPAYPEALACNGVGGVVQLRIRIETDGHVRETEVQRGSGNADLDAAARDAVRTWMFRPALQAGTPVAQWIVVPMTFRVPPTDQCDALKSQASEALKSG